MQIYKYLRIDISILKLRAKTFQTKVLLQLFFRENTPIFGEFVLCSFLKLK